MTQLDLFFQLAASGLTTGCIYGLIGLSFNLIFKSTGAINFAQGEWVMAGGMLAAFLHQSLGLALWLLVPMAIAGVMLLGALSERLAIAPLKTPTPMTITLLTIGVAIATKAAVMLTLGKAPAGLPSFSTEAIAIGGITLHPQTFWIVGVLGAVLAASLWFFDHSLLGRAIRAVASDREAAALVGIDVRRTTTWSFALAAAVGGLAGVIITPVTLTSFNVGLILGFKGFSAAMLGGLGNLYGAIAGGLLLGLLEAMASGFLSSQYKDAVAFLVLLFVLLVRPAGLFGRAELERV